MRGLRLALQPGGILGELDPPEAHERPLEVPGQRVFSGGGHLPRLCLEEEAPLAAVVLLDRYIQVEEPAVGDPPPPP